MKSHTIPKCFSLWIAKVIEAYTVHNLADFNLVFDTTVLFNGVRALKAGEVGRHNSRLVFSTRRRIQAPCAFCLFRFSLSFRENSLKLRCKLFDSSNNTPIIAVCGGGVFAAEQENRYFTRDTRSCIWKREEKRDAFEDVRMKCCVTTRFWTKINVCFVELKKNKTICVQM